MREEDSAAASSARAFWRAVGCVRRKRRVLPRAVAVVSAPAWMRRVTWARFWRGVSGVLFWRRASRQLGRWLVWGWERRVWSVQRTAA